MWPSPLLATHRTAYRLERLEADVADLIARLGLGRVYLAGHDGGGVVAWHVAIHRAPLVRKLAIFNMGHPLAFDDLSDNSDSR